MFRSVLVANRGEIARRVFRTARRMGLSTIAVYSDADADAPHVREADQAVRLGPAPARESYLKVEAVLEAARRVGGGGDPPRLRLPVRERRVRRGRGGGGAGLDRPAAGGDPRHGPEGRRQAADGRGGRAGHAGLPGRGPVARAAGLRGGGDRLSRADQGGGRRGRQGDEAGRRAGGVPRGPGFGQAGGGRGLRRRPGAARDLRHPPAPHRGAGVRRRPRQRRPSVRARLLAAAPPPEGDRGGAGAGHGRRDPRPP